MKKMKRLIPISLLLFLVSVVGCANEFNDRMDAFKRKDYKIAYEKWEPLAEQGYAQAQLNLGVMYGGGHGAFLSNKKLLRRRIV